MHKNTLQHFLRGGGKYPLLPMHQIFGAWSTLEELRNQQLIYESPERIRVSRFLLLNRGMCWDSLDGQICCTLRQLLMLTLTPILTRITSLFDM